MAHPAQRNPRSEKVRLYLAPLDATALAELYQRLTGSPMSPEGLARLREVVDGEPLTEEE